MLKKAAPEKRTVRLVVRGAVQGVGFRPFIWRLARDLGIFGTVTNTSGCVLVHAEGRGDALHAFIRKIEKSPPPMSHIHSIERTDMPICDFEDFAILPSSVTDDFSALVRPDLSICGDCRRELFDPSCRRFQYPFINCTQCGPRYSIVRALPYDRPNTTMSGFMMCEACRAEYENPADRRYHAQPIACPECGPRMWAADSGGNETDAHWLKAFSDAVQEGRIAAVKGVGGFHLVCSIRDAAVRRLRQLKHREAKPFAIMCPGLDWIDEHCILNQQDADLLLSPERSIVILPVAKDFHALSAIAPGLRTLGVMLPNSPAHELMLNAADGPIVMTSANCSSEPMFHRNGKAVERLGGLADIFILHDRRIANRCDDSVCFSQSGHAFSIRPGRGTAPFSFPVESDDCLIAFGADLKNTFASVHSRRLHVSPFIGDLAHPETQEILEEGIQRHIDFFRLTPEAAVCDLHPDYFSTRLAEQFAVRHGIPLIRIQHHHAHLAAAHAEHGLEGKAVGFAFDGTGYGADGALWGGEVMVFDRREYSRVFHLAPVRLPGGDLAVREPQRMLISCIYGVRLAGAIPTAIPEALRDTVVRQIESGINVPLTSSMGRLFDAVSAALGLCSRQTFDGEAAMRLEAAAAPDCSDAFPFSIRGKAIELDEMWDALLGGIKKGKDTAVLAGMFHNTVADMTAACGEKLARAYEGLPWVFSGGVFQNRLLIKKILEHEGVREHRILFSSWPNDTGISMGQAAAGVIQLRHEGNRSAQRKGSSCVLQSP